MFNHEEYESLIKTEYNKIGPKDLEGLRNKMVNSWIDCEIKEDKIDKKYLLHQPENFFWLRCHEMAFKYINAIRENKVDTSNIFFTQGMTRRLYNKNARDTIIQEEHSWIEIGDNIIFDGVLQKFYTKECYYRKKVLPFFKPRRFSFKEATALEKIGYVYFLRDEYLHLLDKKK